MCYNTTEDKKENADMKRLTAIIIVLAALFTLAACGGSKDAKKDAAATEAATESKAEATTEAATDAATTEEATADDTTTPEPDKADNSQSDSYEEEIIGVWSTQINFGSLIEKISSGVYYDVEAQYNEYGVSMYDYYFPAFFNFGDDNRVRISPDKEGLKDTYYQLFTDVYENAKAAGKYSEEVLNSLESITDSEYISQLVESLFDTFKSTDITETYRYTLWDDEIVFDNTTVKFEIDGDTMRFTELMTPMDSSSTYLAEVPLTLTRTSD